MFHPRLRGSHVQIGYKMGSFLKKKAIDFDELIHLDAFQQNFGRKSEPILKEVFPEVCEEIYGLTEALGYSYEKLSSWLLCMGCCYDPKGCTTFCFMHDQKVYYGRNNDLPPFLKNNSQSVLYRLDNGTAFLGNTSSMIHLEEGINAHGLVVAMEFIMPTMIKAGINSVFIVRYLLEKCKTVAEAVVALQKLPIASACNIILVDKTGAMVVAECDPNRMIVRTPAVGEDFLVSTNHFVSDEMRAINSNQIYSSEQRYQSVSHALQDVTYTQAVEHAQAILRGEHGFVCQYDPSLNFETIWSSVFDLSSMKVYRAEGDPSRVAFKEDRRAAQLFET
jgi:predicted choloylglycine hydrolase